MGSKAMQFHGKHYTLIPETLRKRKQWTYSYSRSELKRPLHTDYKPDGALSYEEAVQKAGEDLLVGFYTTHEDPFILIDVDHIANPGNPTANLPPKLSELVITNPTYSEISPSGKGLRYIYQLPDAKDKKVIKGKTFFSSEISNVKEIQMNVGPPWMTITQDITYGSREKIAIVSLDELAEAFKIRYAVVGMDGKPKTLKRTKPAKLPPLGEVRQALMQIPLDANPRVKRAYRDLFGSEYSHYQFWIKTLMALHDYAEHTGGHIMCFELAVLWSEQDVESYQGESDVEKHWSSFSEKEENISYVTLFKLRNVCHLVWPYPKKATDKEKQSVYYKPRPIVGQYKNFEVLLKFYNIEINIDSTDSNCYYISGDSDVIDRWLMLPSTKQYFTDYYGPYDLNSLSAAVLQFVQDNLFIGLSLAKVKEFLQVYIANASKELDIFKMYLDTDFEELPEELQENAQTYHQSTFDYLWSCIEIDKQVVQYGDRELNLYKSYYRKWLMGLLRNVYCHDIHQMNNCILLLTGPEQIRKTSHFRCLLPTQLRHLIAFTTHGFANEANMRDIVKITSSSRIVVWDEFEQFLTQDTESNFKKVIDGIPQHFIDKYQVSTKVFRPIAIYGATSNKSEFNLSGMGSRRIFHIPVKWIDTDRMLQVCWHPVLRELKKEFKDGEQPWLLTEQQLELQLSIQRNIITKTNLDIVLNEIFDWDKEFDNLMGVTNFQSDPKKRLCQLQDVQMILRFSGSEVKSSPTALRRTLARLCAVYTKTIRKTKMVDRPWCMITQGVATDGSGKKRYVLPPMREQYRDLFLVASGEKEPEKL